MFKQLIVIGFLVFSMNAAAHEVYLSGVYRFPLANKEFYFPINRVPGINIQGPISFVWANTYLALDALYHKKHTILPTTQAIKDLNYIISINGTVKKHYKAIWRHNPFEPYWKIGLWTILPSTTNLENEKEYFVADYGVLVGVGIQSEIFSGWLLNISLDRHISKHIINHRTSLQVSIGPRIWALNKAKTVPAEQKDIRPN